MADIVNLNRVRKRKAREAAVAQAEANRAKFGRTRQQKALDAAAEEEARRKLELLRREAPEQD